MISLREVVASLYGAWRLACFDRSALGYFDATPEGFWRSFFAAALIVPFDFSAVLLARDEPLPDDLLHFALGYLVVYVLSWLVWPLAAVYLARMLGRASALPIYLTAHNWAQAPAALFQLIVIVLALGFFPAQTLAAARISFFVILVYEGFIASVALRIDRIVAAGVVGAYFVISYMLALIAVYVMH
ncbi:MAG TPA: hypothetical protein VMV26_12500 [Alphaproteobacteria bacterium]|jgi:hypothetical protein|nr:hypothetical protein [Alphaproteobacteria bacterium]